MIIISVPPLTEERRIQLAKQAKAETEHDKVSIRNARKDANNEIKKVEISDDMKANAESNVQELTNSYIKKIDEMYAKKEVDIMTV